MPHFIRYLNGHIQHPSIGADSKPRLNSASIQIILLFWQPSKLDFFRQNPDGRASFLHAGLEA